MNHLLKAPFCVHPKTGRICIPIDPNKCDELDPSAVPTLSKLIGDLNAGGFIAEGDNGKEKGNNGILNSFSSFLLVFFR